jgi:hypothetical protein
LVSVSLSLLSVNPFISLLPFRLLLLMLFISCYIPPTKHVLNIDFSAHQVTTGAWIISKP